MLRNIEEVCGEYHGNTIEHKTRILSGENMFKIIDLLGHIHDAYGAFPDEDGDIQFVLCDNDGNFLCNKYG